MFAVDMQQLVYYSLGRQGWGLLCWLVKMLMKQVGGFFGLWEMFKAEHMI